MSSDLYFIPLIVRAVGRQAPNDAIRHAFADIVVRGQQPTYENGFRQFLEFMSIAADRCEQIGELAMRRAIVELATGAAGADSTDTEATLEMIRRSSRWAREYEQRLVEVEACPAPTGFSVLLLRGDGTAVGRARLERDARQEAIGRVLPGEYALALDTGWVVWEGTLTDRDLLWTEAFPGRPLRLAADTGKTAGEPTRQLDLVDGELRILVFPGVEAGRIELQWRRHGGDAGGG